MGLLKPAINYFFHPFWARATNRNEMISLQVDKRVSSGCLFIRSADTGWPFSCSMVHCLQTGVWHLGLSAVCFNTVASSELLCGERWPPAAGNGC